MADKGYSAKNLTVLEGLEAVRKRPGMYIGTSDSRGLMHCLWEIIDNSVDEALAGHGEQIQITLSADGSVTVRDNGRGIPVDVEPRSGLTGVELVFTKLHAGGKFGGSGYKTAGGLHGVGASVVNALSARLDVEVDRDGKTYSLSFRHGVPGIFTGEGPAAPFTPAAGASMLRETGRVRKGVSGTRVRYWADPEIFLATAKFDSEALLARARQTAFLVPGLELEIVDERVSAEPGEDSVKVTNFKFAGGISELVEYQAPDASLSEVWRIDDTGSFKETVPVMNEDAGELVTREVERECEVSIAMRWGTGFDTTVTSFVNIIQTPKGGTHLNGFEAGLTRFFRKQIQENARRLKAGGDRPEKDDIMAGLTAVVAVRLPEPQFEGQTKEVLGTAAVRQIVSQALMRGLEERAQSRNAKDRKTFSDLLTKMVGEMKSRIAMRAQRDTARRKSSLENSALPAKLIDCRSKEVDGTELFIVEGDSALGTARPARDSEYQALLPIRGKILNVQKASLADMLANVECGAIIKVLGAGSGRDFDLSQVRYGRVILMTDADVDGAHIRTLLLTLFFKYMRPLLEAGRVYAAVPPLHRVIVPVPGKKPNETIYTYSDAQLHELLERLRLEGRKHLEPIQRYKGLGEMDAEQLAETTMDPEGRLLRRVRVADGQRAAEVFELLMGSDVSPRKDFIVAGAGNIDRSQIDA